MRDEDMTPDEFDAAAEAGESVELNVASNLRIWSNSPFVLVPQAQTWAASTSTTYRLR